MRLWSLHPQYLDPQGLIALWREGLLAQAVLLGITSGYTNHPQLDRFKTELHPTASLSHYLQAVHEEASARGFNFNHHKLLLDSRFVPKLKITTGQLTYELEHLRKKLLVRDPERHQQLMTVTNPVPHPLFIVEEGPVANWEKVISK